MRDTGARPEAPGERVRLRSRRTTVLLVTGCAALLGAYADFGQYTRGFWGTLPEAGTPWALMAFLGGRLAQRRLLAAVAGAGLILVGLATYVVVVHVAYGTPLYNITNDGRADRWAALAILIGGAGGVVGSWTHDESDRLRQVAWGFAIGVPVAEAAHVLLAADQPHATGLALVLLLVGTAVALFAARRVGWVGLAVSAAGWVTIGYAASLVVY